MSTDELILQMQCVMFDGHSGVWDARAKNCEAYADGATPRAAMEAALALRDGPTAIEQPNSDLF